MPQLSFHTRAMIKWPKVPAILPLFPPFCYTLRSEVPSLLLRRSGPFVYVDVTNRQQLEEIVVTHGVTRVLHLAAVLSAVGEQAPLRAMEVNLAGTHNVLEIARVHGLEVGGWRCEYCGNTSRGLHVVLRTGTVGGFLLNGWSFFKAATAAW